MNFRRISLTNAYIRANRKPTTHQCIRSVHRLIQRPFVNRIFRWFIVLVVVFVVIVVAVAVDDDVDDDNDDDVVVVVVVVVVDVDVVYV